MLIYFLSLDKPISNYAHKKTEQIETKIDPSIKLFSSLAAEISPSTPSVNTQTSIQKQKK